VLKALRTTSQMIVFPSVNDAASAATAPSCRGRRLSKRLLGGDDRRKIRGMTDATKNVLAVALRLDVDARAELAAEILASLDGPADRGAEAAWALEIEHRVAAIETGAMPLESWDVVKRRVEKEILGR